MRLTPNASRKPSASVEDAPALDDSAWPRQASSTRLTLSPVTALLSVALIAVLGVWGGAELQKRQGGSSPAAASGLPADFAGRFGNRTGAGAAGTGTAGRGLAVGTVTVISGKTLYLTSLSGAIIKAKLNAGTTYTRSAKTTKSSLKPGDTAIVQGAKNAAGVIVATAVTATAKGVGSATGGFPGGLGGVPTGNGAPNG